MTEPTTITVIDKDGNRIWASRRAPFILDGLADGTLREVPSAALPTQGAHHDPGPTDGPADSGSDDGERSDPGSGDEVGDGVDGAAPNRGTRRRR